MTRIARAVARCKDAPDAGLDRQAIGEVCREVGHRWRDRVLDPASTIYLLLVQMLHGNCACRTLPHLANMRFTDTAYCKARARLPLDLFVHLAGRLIGQARQHTRDMGRWLGHRVFLIDGTGVSMPDTPALQNTFGQPGRCAPGCGFPVMHLLVLFDHATGLLVDLMVSRCNTHDLSQASGLHPSLEPGDVMVGDRAFCSFAHFALLLQQNLHGVFRLHQRIVVDFTPGRKARPRSRKRRHKGRPAARQVRKLGHEDQLIQCPKPSDRPAWMSAEVFAWLPDTIVLRELRYRVRRKGFRTRQATLWTTLTDVERYPKPALVELYGQRWEVETNLRYLKQTLGLDVLKSKSEDVVMKELWAFVLVYNLVRLAMLDAARRQAVDPSRISFIDTLDMMRYRPPDQPPPRLKVNPDRPGRVQPRGIKRPKDRYTYLTRPRHELLQALMNAEVVA